MFHTSLTCQWSSKWYFGSLHWLFCELCAHFHLHNLWRNTWTLTIFNHSFPNLNSENYSKVCILPIAPSINQFWAFHVLLNSMHKLKAHLIQTCYSFKSIIRKFLDHTQHTKQQTPTAKQCRLCIQYSLRLIQKTAILWHLEKVRCTTCHFWS